MKIAVLSRRHYMILARVLQSGFLLSIESLLSTVGHEMGMIEDMAAVTEFLNTVSVRLLHYNDESITVENHGTKNTKEVSGGDIGVCGNTTRIWRQSNRQIVVDLIVDKDVASLVQKIQEIYSPPLHTFDPYNPYDLCGYEVIGTLKICGVMFQQGINEQQSAANMLPGIKQQQRDINSRSLSILQNLFDYIIKFIGK